MDEYEKIIPFDRRPSAKKIPREEWTKTEQAAVALLTAGILETEKKYRNSFHELLGGVPEVHCHIYNGRKVFEAIYPYTPCNPDGAETIAHAIIELIEKVGGFENITKFNRTRFEVISSCGFRDESE